MLVFDLISDLDEYGVNKENIEEKNDDSKFDFSTSQQSTMTTKKIK